MKVIARVISEERSNYLNDSRLIRSSLRLDWAIAEMELGAGEAVTLRFPLAILFRTFYSTNNQTRIDTQI